MTNSLDVQRAPSRYGLRAALELIHEHKRAYLAVNGFFYGLVLIGMAVAFLNPSLREELWKAVGHEVTQGSLAPLAKAYTTRNLPVAIAGTFLVNLIAGSILYINVPSAVVPFLGFLLAAWRALLWGFLFMPVENPMGRILLPHFLTLILEGQGYVLATFAVYVQGKSFLAPKTMGVETHVQGYVLGLKHTASLYVVVSLTLLVAACYEAILGVYIAPLLAPGK